MKYLLVLFFLFSLATTRALAADFTINCDDSSCTPSTISSFLPSTPWYPGFSIARTLQITNNSLSQTSIEFKAVNQYVENELDEVIATDISSNSTLFTGSLMQLLTTSSVQGGTINALSSKTYTYNFSMNQSAGNQYQDSHAIFDLAINVREDENDGASNNTGGASPTPSPTPSQNSGSNSDSGSTNSDSGNQDNSSNTQSSNSQSNNQSPVDAVLQAITNTFSAINPFDNQEQQPKQKEVLATTDKTENPIKALSESCSTNPWWPVVLLIQTAGLMITKRVIKSKKSYFFIAILTLGSAVALYLLACSLLLVLLSLVPLVVIEAIWRKEANI